MNESRGNRHSITKKQKWLKEIKGKIQNTWRSELSSSQLEDLYENISEKYFKIEEKENGNYENGVKPKHFTYFTIEDLLFGKLDDEDHFDNSFILFKFDTIPISVKEMSPIILKDSKFHISCCLPYDTYYTLEEFTSFLFISFKYNIVDYSTNTLFYEKVMDSISMNINPISNGKYIELISFIPILHTNNNNNNSLCTSFSISQAMEYYIRNSNPSYTVINISGFLLRSSPFVNETDSKTSSIILTMKDKHNNNNNTAYIIIRNNSKYYYKNTIKIYKEYTITNIKPVKLNNNNNNNNIQIYESTDTTSIIPNNNNNYNYKRIKSYYTKYTIKNIIENEIIDYIGVITNIIIDTVIEIDNSIYCLVSHISLINQELGIRIGCRVYITGVHTIYSNRRELKGLGLCYNSNIQVIEFSNLNYKYYPISVERSKLNKYLSNNTYTYSDIIELCYLLQSLFKNRLIRYCDVIPINTSTNNTSVLEYLLPNSNKNDGLYSYDFYSEIIYHNSDECRVIYDNENDDISFNKIPHLLTLRDIYLRFQKCNKTGYFSLKDTEFYSDNQSVILLGFISEDGKNGLFLVDQLFTCRMYYDRLVFPELSLQGKNKVLVIIDKFNSVCEVSFDKNISKLRYKMSLFPKSMRLYNKMKYSNNNNNSVILPPPPPPPPKHIHNEIKSKLLIYLLKTPLIYNNNNNDNYSYINGFIINNNTIEGYCSIEINNNNNNNKIAGFNMLKEGYVYEITNCKVIEEECIYLLTYPWNELNRILAIDNDPIHRLDEAYNIYNNNNNNNKQNQRQYNNNNKNNKIKHNKFIPTIDTSIHTCFFHSDSFMVYPLYSIIPPPPFNSIKSFRLNNEDVNMEYIKSLKNSNILTHFNKIDDNLMSLFYSLQLILPHTFTINEILNNNNNRILNHPNTINVRGMVYCKYINNDDIHYILKDNNNNNNVMHLYIPLKYDFIALFPGYVVIINNVHIEKKRNNNYNIIINSYSSINIIDCIKISVDPVMNNQLYILNYSKVSTIWTNSSLLYINSFKIYWKCIECKKIIDYSVVEILPITLEESNPIDNSIFASTVSIKPVCVNGCCKCRKLYCCCDMSCKIDDGTSTAVAYCNGKLCFTLLEIYNRDIVHFIHNLLLEGKTYEYSNSYFSSNGEENDSTIFSDSIRKINCTAPVYNMKVRFIKKSNNSSSFMKTISVKNCFVNTRLPDTVFVQIEDIAHTDTLSNIFALFNSI